MKKLEIPYEEAKQYTNLVDDELRRLVKIGLLEEARGMNLYDKDYWRKFIKMCDKEIIDAVLALPQSGYWNGWLYAVCEEARGKKPNR